MKKIFTLCCMCLLGFLSKSQVVLNEFYPEPGSGRHEFFEFYNTSTSAVPENMDNYTMLSYYEEPGGITGFYVMDLPNLTVGPKGYFVGASASPYNIQSQSGLIPNFNWNAMPAGGALTKWQRNGAGYTQVAVPANLNDFITTRSGSGGKNFLFVYKNGLLINGVITGVNAAVIPAYIKAMPDLPVDMSGTSIDFTANFSTLNDNQVEYVNATAGNDNGFIRIQDGVCGVWNKSSAAIQHTPGVTNGTPSGAETGTLSISYSITEILADPTKSLLTYNVTSTTLSAFPVTVVVYRDIGIVGTLDAADQFVDSRVIATLTAGDQFVTLPTRNDPVIMICISPSGCFDRVIYVPNGLSTLPVHLVSFQGNMDKNKKVTLSWTISDNETASSFEVERSTNGRDYTTVAVVLTSDKIGTENYKYFETLNTNEKVMYRLKMIDKGHDVDYSKILVFQSKSTSGSGIKVIGNPVYDKLTFSYTSITAETVNVKVFDAAGRLMMNQKVNSMEGNNLMSLSLGSAFKPGLYVLEITNSNELQTAKFLKQ